MFVKIIAPDGEYKREGLSINDHIERNRELFLNINEVKSIHVIGNRLYFDRLRLTFETENAAKDAINGLTEAIRNKEALTEISRSLVTVKALSGCTVNMINGAVEETDDGPAKPEPVEADPVQPEQAEATVE
jgi:hypothetical protein